MTAPGWERQAHLRVIAWEAALAGSSRNGASPAEDVVWLVSHDAIRAPATAARCPAVCGVLPAEILAAVTRLAGQPSQEAGSAPDTTRVVTGPLTTTSAAALLGLKPHAVAAACRRGSLPAVHDQQGRWVIDPADLETYRRQHEQITR